MENTLHTPAFGETEQVRDVRCSAWLGVTNFGETLTNKKDKMTTDLENAFKACEDARNEGLRGKYPHACITLEDEVLRCYEMLKRIAYPRRETRDDLASLQDFADEIQKAWSVDDTSKYGFLEK